MPRPYQGPKLWLDPKRDTWTIIDGRRRQRTGLFAHERDKAQEALERHRATSGMVVSDRPVGPRPAHLKKDKRGVYVLGFGPYVKIGISVNIKYRMAALQLPEEPTLYAILDGWRQEELALHGRFAAYRLRGEWFRKEGELASWIEAKCPLANEMIDPPAERGPVQVVGGE